MKIGNLTFDAEDPDRLATFWAAALGLRKMAYPDDMDISASPGERATRDQVDAEMDRIRGLSATLVRTHDGTWGPWPEYHHVMTDPEGNEFCVQ